jgi:PhnB protein
MAQAIPQGFSTITPHLSLENAEQAIALYKKAFGAVEEGVTKCPNTGKIMHACLTIGTSKLFLADHMPESGCGELSQSGFYLYLPDVDAAFAKAKNAGLTEKMAPADMFWGDRVGTLTDSFGQIWTIATHVRDVSKDELEKAAKEWSKQQAA